MTRPFAFGKPFDAADHDVRAKAAAGVTYGGAERRNRSVGGNQQGQHIEAIFGFVVDQCGAGTGNRADVS
ncbi:MAG: hypothetical protein U0Q16_32545 [Bryobacteraceae bacterium]